MTEPERIWAVPERNCTVYMSGNSPITAQDGPFTHRLHGAASEYIRADLVAALEAENQRLRKIIDKMEWQPIETAPKDGSLVLLHTPDTHTYTPVLGTWNYFEESWEEWGDYCQCYPTHWLPLPEPPKEASHDD